MTTTLLSPEELEAEIRDESESCQLGFLKQAYELAWTELRREQAPATPLPRFIATNHDALRPLVVQMVRDQSDHVGGMLEGREGRGNWFPMFAEVPDDAGAFVRDNAGDIADELLAYHALYRAGTFNDPASDSLFESMEGVALDLADKRGVKVAE